MIKKKDIILIFVILVIALASFTVLRLTQKDGNQVVISLDGKVIETIDLSEYSQFKIEDDRGSNTIVVNEGKVTMKKADCPDQICVNHPTISKTGETIVCLPHKVVVEITNKDNEKEIDGITR